MVRVAILMVLLLTLGCATDVLDKYDHQHSYHCRIDNPDQDSLWDTSDENGNGRIDEGETAGPVFDFATLAGEYGASDDHFYFASGASRSSGSSTTTSSFGSVALNYRTPTGFLSGISDYHGQSLPTVSPAVFPGSDVAVGDLNGNGLSFFFIDLDNDGEFAAGEPFGFDFGDLHTFNLFFDRIVATPHVETHGMQVSSRHRFTPKPDVTEPATETIDVSFGARYFRLTEKFLMEGYGSILGKTIVDMTYDNRLFGPQLAVDWQRPYRGWNLSAGYTVMVGYGGADGQLHANIGQDLLPGGLSSPAVGRPTTTVLNDERERLATIAEVRAQATYPLRKRLNLLLGYHALYISDLRHAGESIDWELPNPGILDRGTGDAWLDGLHASIEWRR